MTHLIAAALGMVTGKPRVGTYTTPGGGLWLIHEPTADALLHQWLAMAPTAVVPQSDGSQATPEKKANVALVSLDGPMSRGGTPCFGAGSTIDARSALRQAERDEDVTAIVFVIDSPGGTVAGTGDLGDEVARIKATKPVYVYVPDMACSAAYWVASQATEIWASPNATAIGNINARRTLVNVAASLRKSGVEVTILKGQRGKYKDAGDGTKPFTEDELAYLQEEIDRMEAKFAAAVSKGRSISMEKALEWSDGRWFDAEAALGMGLIDKTGTLDDLIDAIVKPVAEAAPVASVLRADFERVEAKVAAVAPKPLLGWQATGEVKIGSPAPLVVYDATDDYPVYGGVRVQDAPAYTVEHIKPTPTISAPGGQPGSAGNQTAPIAGAESTQTGKNPMSFRQNLINLMGAKGYGRTVAGLNATQSEDPEVLARIVTENVEAQAQELHDRNPILATLRARGITDHTGLDGLLAQAQNGTEYLNDLRAEAKKEATRALGGEDAAPLLSSISTMNLTDARAWRDHYRAKADARVGIAADGSAPERKTAPSGVVAVDASATKTTTRRWDSIPSALRERAQKDLKLDTEAKQNKYAENVPDDLLEEN